MRLGDHVKIVGYDKPEDSFWDGLTGTIIGLEITNKGTAARIRLDATGNHASFSTSFLVLAPETEPVAYLHDGTLLAPKPTTHPCDTCEPIYDINEVIRRILEQALENALDELKEFMP